MSIEDSQNTIHEEPFDLRQFFNRFILRHWKLYLVCLISAFLIAYFYTWYATPVYKASGTVLVKTKNNGDVLDILNYESTSSDRNIQNEIVILKSRSLITKTLSGLDFQISYFKKQKFRTRELYRDSPFEVIPDSLSFLVYSTPISLNILDTTNFKISFKLKEVSYNFIGKFGEAIPTPLGKLNFLKKDNNGTNFWNRAAKKDYLIKFNNAESLIAKYSTALQIDVAKQASILTLSVKDNIPQRSIDFLNRFVETWLQNTVEDKNQIARKSLQFIDEQLALISRDLTEAEKSFERFKSSKAIIDLTVEGQTYLQNANTYDQNIAQNNLRLNLLSSLEEYVKEGKNLEKIYPATLDIPDDQLHNLIAQLNQLYGERDKLSLDHTPDHPSLVANNIAIEALKQSLLQTINNNKNILEAERAHLYEQVRGVEDKIRQLPGTQREAINYQRQVDLNASMYTFLSQKRAENAIILASTPSDNRIIDKATVSSVPVKPIKGQVYLVSIILGLAVPIGFVYLRTLIDDRIKELSVLEKQTSIPLLGVIGINHSGKEMVVKDHPRSQVTEAFRSIRTNLQYFLKKELKSQTILITSSISAEGKSFCAVNLAGILAISGKKTVILGFDLRKPKSPEQFDLKNEIGISNYLIGTSELNEIIQNTMIPNLSFILSGPKPPNPAELLMSEKVDSLFNYLREHYEYIIVDSPPIGIITDSLILYKHADATVYIVRQNVTRYHHLNGVNKLYKEEKIKNLSIIYNAVSHDPTLYNYGYAYGYGYGYYENGEPKFKVKSPKFLFNS